MESTTSKKPYTMRKRTSFSFLFNSQKPTFSLWEEGPTRYYDFVDTPTLFRPSPPLIDRQKIPPALEADIRYSCSLLVYRVERGVPSRATKQIPSHNKDNEAVTSGVSSSETQIESKYSRPNVAPEAAAMKGKHDSGVGLTQQPSRQTIRMLQSSHSDKPSDLGELKESSPADQRQYSTIAPNTKYTGRRISQTPTSSSGQTQMQSMTGASAIGHAQTPDQDTMNFLASAGKSPPSSSGDDRPDDVEVFLNPDATLMSTGVASFSSPETLLNLPSPDFESSSNNAPSRQSQPNISSDTQVDETQMIGLGTSGIEKSEHQPGIIIDRTGYMHVMTVEEETERNKQLQQAVMAKMKSVPASPESLNAQNAQPNKNMAKRPCTSDKRPQSVASRLQSSWSSKTGGTLSKWKCRSEVPTNSQSQRPTLFQKIARFFGERRIQERAWAY